jgi:anti-anti-sigma factor
MAVEVVETPEGLVVRLSGEAGIPEAGALEAAVSRLVARRPACVTFDLSELRLISSLAMGVLVAFRRAATRAGARVCLVPDLRPAVREALERAELLSLFETARRAVPDGGKRYPSACDVERTHGVTWGRLVELEPRLDFLLWRARLAGGGCRAFTDVDRVFGPLRNELAELIGFAGTHHRHPVLGGVGAYEVAYWKLYDAVAGLLPARAGGAGEAPAPCLGESGAPCDEGEFIGGLGI